MEYLRNKEIIQDSISVKDFISFTKEYSILDFSHVVR